MDDLRANTPGPARRCARKIFDVRHPVDGSTGDELARQQACVDCGFEERRDAARSMTLR
jgi:hypothetical protein